MVAGPRDLKNSSVSLPKDSTVTKETLIKYRIISPEALNHDIKILGEGSLTLPLTIMLPVSKNAAKKVVAAGGKIEITVAAKNKSQ